MVRTFLRKVNNFNSVEKELDWVNLFLQFTNYSVSVDEIMAKTTHRRRPRDQNQLAKMVVDMAVRNIPNDEDKKPFRIVLKKKK